jgi:predicted permease
VTSLIARFAEVGYGPAWFNGVFTGGATVTGLRQSVIGDSERPLLIVLGALAVVFLIACGNIANLFLVRERTRLRETAVRLALGATRGQLVRYTLAEGAMIAIAAGLLGVLLAAVGTRVLLALQPAAIPRLHEVGVGLPVFAFIALISFAAAVLLGVLPALKAGSVRVSDALREGGRSGMAGRESQAVRGLLVVTQVAMAVILLVGAGLMVRSAQALRKVDAGFDADGVIAFTVSLPPAKYAPPDRMAAFFHELTGAIAAMPGVAAVGAIDALPLSGGGPILATIIEGRPLAQGEFPPVFHVRRVTPGYFEAMRIPVVDGRGFEPTDHQRRLNTAVISSTVRNEFFSGTSPLGRRVAPGGGQVFSSVVGVVGDVRDTGLDEQFDDFIYLPMVDSLGGTNRMTFVVRTAGDPMRLMPTIRSEITNRDPNLPITDIRLLEQTVSDSMADLTFTMLLLSIAAAIALVLGSVGIYGLIAYVVGQRTSEIGIRMSLGANPSAVMRLFLMQAWALAGAGVAIGLLASLAATRALGALIYGISAFDVVTLVLAPALFLVVATLACLIPCGRAASVDPAVAIRRG